ncbi:MAG: hypothetical protein A2V81_01060 [Candidatus Abawacabacteria bacterium RBG_16_42_10]|uniref:Uncharacterized protein n=1 Tax=Candidatus Abawacabacteria bacterium RBG_16_42_10 TaxID=1817814 RepID=A0A1F4XLJ8_9BACT|nr:MAG: hypothetical protein A2V81_01060 [Candidatus Abawacabacteria bacterium RBG_16_42_10]
MNPRNMDNEKSSIDVTQWQLAAFDDLHIESTKDTITITVKPPIPLRNHIITLALDHNQSFPMENFTKFFEYLNQTVHELFYEGANSLLVGDAPPLTLQLNTIVQSALEIAGLAGTKCPFTVSCKITQ